MVSDGTTRFNAYSSITSLRNDTVVYVTVPNGDFTQQKIIVGKQMDGEDKTFLYTAPFDNFIRCTPNLLTQDESTNLGNGYRLYANGTLVNDSKELEDILDKDNNSIGKKFKSTFETVTNRKDLVNYYKDFTRLGIRANFIAWLKEYDIASGDYGLAFTVSYQDGELDDVTNLTDLGATEELKAKYLRNENGYNIDREYYTKTGNDFKIVDKFFQQKDYKPNHYYYKNYVLDYDRTPRKKYTYYEKVPIEQLLLNEQTNKIESTVIGHRYLNLSSDKQYEPGKYYYIPEEGLENSLQYKLSEDNGFIPNCQYFAIVDEKFTPIVVTVETYTNNLYGVKPVLKTKVKTMTLNTNQMLGNVYGFDDYYQQEMVFDISGLGTITGIDLRFYENGNFVSNNDNNNIHEEGIPKLFNSQNNNPGYETLVVNNIEVYMGYETAVLGEDEDGYLKLFCYETDKYKAVSNPLLNMKNIYLKWAYKQDDGKIYIADKDNVGTFIEQLKDGISDFPIYDEDKKNKEIVLNYCNNLVIDNSPVGVENRNYYERFITDDAPTNISGMAGKAYIKATYNFIPNQGNPYCAGRDYFEYGIFSKEEGENLIKKEGFKKQIISINEDGEVVQAGTQYLKKTSTGDYLYQNPAIGTTIKGSEWYKYDYVSVTETQTPTHYRGYKKVNISENISQDKLYNYYYAVYTGINLIAETATDLTEDNGDYIYIYYLAADMNVMGYKPETYYYYNCPNDLFEVRWYRYAHGKPAADEYSGIYWEAIPNLPKLINEVYQNTDLTPEEKSDKIKQIYDELSYSTHLIDDFQCELHPDYVYNEKEQIKAIIRLVLGEETKIFYSEPIEFFNESPTIDLPSLEVETALAPKFDDGSLGNYYLYGENNSLIDMGDAQVQRSISLLFDATNGVSGSRSLLKDAEKVTWIFPLNNTCVVPSLALTQGVYTEKDGFGYLEDTEKRQEYKFYYTIEKYYSYTDGDNAIVCNVVKDGILYSTTANMSFGQSGSNGSEYTLVLDLMTADNMITLNPTNNLYYKGLYNYKKAYPLVEGQTIFAYPTKEKESDGFYYLEATSNNEKVFKKINIDDYDWLTIGYNNLYVVREWKDTEENRSDYPCLDEYLYDYDGENKSKVNINTNPINEEIKVVASLYDQTHKRIDINDYNITWKWEVCEGSLFNSTENTFESASSALILFKKNNRTSISKTDIYILKATLNDFQDYALEAFLCLPLREDFGPVRYQGPVEILHNSLGTPQFYKDEINLYYNDKDGNFNSYPINGFSVADSSKESKDQNGLFPQVTIKNQEFYEYIQFDSYDQVKQTSICYKEIQAGIYERVKKTEITEENYSKYYFKQLDSQKSSSKCYFQTPSIFISGMQPFSVQYKFNDKIKFLTPILYIQNRYFSSTINKWDGKLLVDDDDNTILAKMIGAGSKNSNNQFSGVIMGDWSANTNSSFGIGLYGFNKGDTSFGFTDNGQGFIGKADRGRIVFDGDNAQLRSANYNAGPFTTDNSLLYSQNGMLIDLDDAFLIATGSQKKLTDDKGNIVEIINRYIKIDGLTSGANNSPGGAPTPGGTNTDYPFVVYGGPELYTEIGWNGDLKLKGSYGSGGTGSISLDASGAVPFEIKSANKTYNESTGVIGIANRYVQINWDASIILSGAGWKNKILLDASAPELASLPEQYKSTGTWIASSEDRPFQIGSYLRATWDGYLEAQGAYFKNSNANTFNIHYPTDNSINDNFFIGRGVAGKIGFLGGFSENGKTNNLGIISTDGHGIKLNSQTNLSISALKKSNQLSNIEKDNQEVASAAILLQTETNVTHEYKEVSAYDSTIKTYYYKLKDNYYQGYYINDLGEQDYIIDSADEYNQMEKDIKSLLELAEDDSITFYIYSFKEESGSDIENSTTKEETLPDDSSNTVDVTGGIYLEAARVISLRTEADKSISTMNFTPTTITTFMNTKFEILDINSLKNDSYHTLLSLENDVISKKIELKSKVDNVYLDITNFVIQKTTDTDGTTMATKLFDISQSNNATSIHTKETSFTISGNTLRTNGGIEILGVGSDTQIGLFNRTNTTLLGRVKIGSDSSPIAPLDVSGNAKISGTTTTGGLIAGKTDGYSIQTDGNTITFTGGAARQTGIYARFA